VKHDSASGSAWHSAAAVGTYHREYESKHNPTTIHHEYIRTSESRWGCNRATASVSLQLPLRIRSQSRHLQRESPNALKADI
jgi:hypothetical protein